MIFENLFGPNPETFETDFDAVFGNQLVGRRLLLILTSTLNSMLSAGGNHHRSADCKQCWTEEFACKHGCCPAGFISRQPWNMRFELLQNLQKPSVGWIMFLCSSKILRSLHVRSGSQRKGARRRCGYCWRVPRRALVGHATECRHNTDSARFGKLLGVLFQIVSSFLGMLKAFSLSPSDHAASMI